MKKQILLLSLLLISVSYLSAQKEFKLNVPQDARYDSHYSQVELLDSRPNQGNYGYVLSGLFDDYHNVVVAPPMITQLNNFLQNNTDRSALDKVLLFQLRDLEFGRMFVGRQSVGICHIRFNLYNREGDDFYFLERIDTLVSAKPKELFNATSNAIVSVLARNLARVSDEGVPFTLAGVHNIDAFEKEEIPIYNTAVYKDGIYPNYYSFSILEPDDVQLQTKMKDDELKEIKFLNTEKNRWERVKAENVYAIVVEGQPYISYENKFYAGYLEDGEFKFKYSRKVNSASGFSVGIGVGTGGRGGSVGGGIVLSPKKTVTNIMKIDHLDGSARPVE